MSERINKLKEVLVRKGVSQKELVRQLGKNKQHCFKLVYQ